mgnify:FL=1
MIKAAVRSERLALRLSSEARLILSAAASASKQSLNEFVLESALERAAETLPDRQRFELDAARSSEFKTALDAPPRPLTKLEALLTKPSILEARKK